MERQHILSEIRRTAKANAGTPLGWRRFEEATGIRYHDWYGQFWAKWSDAVREAGLEPNRMVEPYDERTLIEKLIALTRKLGRVPTHGDVVLAVKNDVGFPAEKTFRRLGTKIERASRIQEYCEANAGCEDVIELWRSVTSQGDKSTTEGLDSESVEYGYVYLLRHGTRHEYKLGRTNNPLRREGELGIQLPEKLHPVHYIQTDDPSGVEAYWHRRFADRRREGEWFTLTAQDVRAFKRWKRIF